MAQSFENELNNSAHDDLYAEMYETLYGLQDDFDLYRGKIDEALMLITIMEQRQANFIKEYGKSPPNPATLRRSSGTKPAAETSPGAEESLRRTESYRSPSQGQSRTAPGWDDIYTSTVQQQMRLTPDRPRYPAYYQEDNYSRAQSQAEEKPEVTRSSKSVRVPEKYLYEDDDRSRSTYSKDSGKHSRSKTADAKASGGKKKAQQAPKHAKTMPGEEAEHSEKPISKKQKRVARAKDAIFYLVLVILVSAVLVVSISSGSGVRSFAGFSAFVVKSSSMEDVYPKNSVILAKSVEPSSLRVGDDITFFTNSTTTVTHRIITVYENYDNSGHRGFETKGTMNENPDKDIVSAVNVIGRVVFCSTLLGAIILFVSKNWPLLIFFAVVIVVLVIVMKKILKS